MKSSRINDMNVLFPMNLRNLFFIMLIFNIFFLKMCFALIFFLNALLWVRYLISQECFKIDAKITFSILCIYKSKCFLSQESMFSRFLVLINFKWHPLIFKDKLFLSVAFDIILVCYFMGNKSCNTATYFLDFIISDC